MRGLQGIFEIKNDSILKARRIYMKNPYQVAEMNINIGDKFLFEGEEYKVVLFLKSDNYVFLDVDKI